MDTETLYFHASCFDGAASAALTLDVLERCLAWKRPLVRPVNYDARGQWHQMPTGRFAVVDFLYHPAAEFWTDHHTAPFLTPADGHHALTRADGRAHYDASAPSCASVLWSRYKDSIRERFPAPSELVRWADKIDSAAYESVEEALFSPAPALSVSRALAQADDSLMVEVVDALRLEPLDIVARSRRIDGLSKGWLKGQAEALRTFEKVARLSDDGIVLFEISNADGVFSRYFPFYVFRDARYSLGLISSATGAKLTAMRNPWRQFESVPLGSIFAAHGGGGHQRIGSVLLPNASIEHARRVMNQLCGMIVTMDREQRETEGSCTSGSTSTTFTPTSSPG
jgi:hypothetical protein